MRFYFVEIGCAQEFFNECRTLCYLLSYYIICCLVVIYPGRRSWGFYRRSEKKEKFYSHISCSRLRDLIFRAGFNPK
jgi:hypothetical protein